MEKSDNMKPIKTEHDPMPLKDEASKIIEILTEAQECFKVLEYILVADPKTDIYAKERNDFWHFNVHIYADQVLLKLNILLSPREHFSIEGLLCKLIEDEKFSGIISPDQVELWRAELRKLRGTIKKIRAERNQRIAHQDKTYLPKKRNEIKLSELQKMIALIRTILKEIYFRADLSVYLIEDPVGSPLESLKTIMVTLNEERRRSMAWLFEEGRKYGLHDELPPSERKEK